MDLPIFFLDNYSASDILTLNEDTSRHVVQVLRMKPLAKLQLTDGLGNLLTVEIIDDHKKRCTVRVISRDAIPKKQQQVSVGIALLKNSNRLEWFLEKATEIGVTEIIPLLSDRTEKQHFRYDRMQQILISAMMQSKQVWLPVLHEPTPFVKVIETSAYTTKLIGYCEELPKASVTDFRKDASVQILIGPEGDFTAEEISFALNSDFKAVTLGNTRLRTETAGVVAATILCI